MPSFAIIYLITQLLGIVVAVLTIIWITVFAGIVWDVKDPRLQNWHAICMVLGMIFFYGNCKFIIRRVKETKSVINFSFHQ